MIRCRTLSGLIVLSLVFSFALAAVAKTPDGQTPAEETVCDIFSGALFGLCNAACEAMDCGDINQHASEQACDSMIKNWQKKTDTAGPPCVCEDICRDNGTMCRQGCIDDCVSRCLEKRPDATEKACQRACLVGDIRPVECLDGCQSEYYACSWGCCEQTDSCPELPRCSNPGTCGTFEPCEPGTEECNDMGAVCFTRPDGSGVCKGPVLCEGLITCDENGDADCPVGYFCEVDSCCSQGGGDVCVPVSSVCPNPLQPNPLQASFENAIQLFLPFGDGQTDSGF